jgi:alpha-L-rhamnosidase
MTVVNHLRCEHLASPIGIETPAPRLGWSVEADVRGARQTAYRITVASAPELLAEEGADLWDSGKVESDASVLISYAGRKLCSRQRCWWRVHVWDEAGRESVSAPAFWEMALLRHSDWKAQWVAGDTPKKHHDVPASPMFRKAFALKKPVASARAYVCGLGFHEFHLNGKKVGDAVLAPAFTKYDARVLYTVYDVTDCLQRGDNAIGVVTGTGWYNHHTKCAWDLHVAPWCDECKALVQIEITFEDGSRTAVLSDASWLYATGPIVFDGLRNGEIYDARQEQAGWNEPAYEPTDWQPVRIARPPGGVLHAQTMPPCRVMETIRPVSMTEVRHGVWVYDMGRNIAGWARLSVSGPAGTTVVMKYAENLGPDGDIDQSNIAGLIKTDVFQTDTYILKGAGVESYEARFTYHGFQYVQVTGLPVQATLDTLEGRVVNTDIERAGSFACSNELLNRIQDAAVAATVGNYHGMPTDCPHREKNGWTGDAQLSAEQVLYNFDPAAAYTKWMDDFVDCQRPSGALPGIVPTGGWGYNWGAGPAWDSAYILIPWYLYVYRGDLEILRWHYDGMVKYLGFLATLATDHIVHFGLGDWCPPTPGAGSHKAPAELTNTAYYYSDACIVARVASLLGRKGDARRFGALAKKIKAAARKRYYDKKAHRLAGHSQTSIACFLYQGLVETDEVESFGAMLLDEVAACNDHIDCGILGTKYVLNVLTELGRADVAYRIATQRDYPSWGLWIEQGATTLWETWDGRASRNHHMFSDISAWFYKTLAGILPDPEHPGFQHATIKPWPVGDLTDVSAEIRTPYGQLRSAWNKEDDRFVLDVTIPANSTATVHVPTADASGVTESGRPAGAAEHVAACAPEPGRAIYNVAAGSYRFETGL